jgi:hypothetical protein
MGIDTSDGPLRSHRSLPSRPGSGRGYKAGAGSGIYHIMTEEESRTLESEAVRRDHDL